MYVAHSCNITHFTCAKSRACIVYVQCGVYTCTYNMHTMCGSESNTYVRIGGYKQYMYILRELPEGVTKAPTYLNKTERVLYAHSSEYIVLI